MSRHACTLVLASLLFALSGAQCVVDLLPLEEGEAGLIKFSSEAELRRYMAEQAKKQAGRYNGWGGGLAPTAEFDGAAGEADDSSSVLYGDYSTTNVQELGVDESDYIKNDGETIYVLENSTIHILKATPAESLEELATVDVASYGQSMYLYGDTLIALSQETLYWIYDDVIGDSSGGGSGVSMGSAGAESTDPKPASDPAEQDIAVVGGEWNDGWHCVATFINVADPGDPQIIGTVEIEGNLIDSRMIDDKLHLIMTTTPRLPTPLTDEAVDGMTTDEWLPKMKRDFGDAATTNAVGWDDLWRPLTSDGYGMTLVVTIDADDPSADHVSTGVAADAGTIYASTESLYVTDTEYSWTTFSSRTDTIVHKLSFTATGTSYVGSGSVPGRTLNQYSMGEHNDYLRLATTGTQVTPSGTTSSNSVYVLGESASTTGVLDVVGRIEGIAPGEEIYAARFFGDRGFLVTFERVDPLFTLDLSDPADPQIVGQLKVPGYSDHIQMLGENHLLTVGHDTEDAGDWVWIRGVQLSIFDVSDMSNPQQLFTEVIGGRGTYSEANHNPKAFNYFASRDLLALPIVYYSDLGSGSMWGGYDHTGLYVYRVDETNGFEPLGYVRSDDDIDQSGCYYGFVGFTRGVFIGDNVYTITDGGVKVCDVEDTSTIIAEAVFEVDNNSGSSGCWLIDDVVLPEDDFSVR